MIEKSLNGDLVSVANYKLDRQCGKVASQVDYHCRADAETPMLRI